MRAWFQDSRSSITCVKWLTPAPRKTKKRVKEVEVSFRTAAHSVIRDLPFADLRVPRSQWCENSSENAADFCISEATLQESHTRAREILPDQNMPGTTERLRSVRYVQYSLTLSYG